jgi:hypothetical protein
VVAGALSQKYEDEGSLFSLSILPDWLQYVRQEWIRDPKISHMIQQLKSNSPVSQGTLGTMMKFSTKVVCI